MRTRIKECKKCGHKWLARLITRKIHLCPKCKSTRWYIDDNPPQEGDAVTGRHSILGSPEGHQDSETGDDAMGSSGCLQAATPAQSPHNDAEEGLAMEQPLKSDTPTPTELHRASKGWLSEVDRIHNEARDAMERAVNPAWLKPSDPAIMPAPERPSGTIKVTLEYAGRGAPPEVPKPDFAMVDPGPPPALTIRRVEVPKEARGWDDEEDDGR